MVCFGSIKVFRKLLYFIFCLSTGEPFKKLNDLFNEIAQEMGDDSCFDTLSMGMSSDLDAAIYENTNIVRVGTDIFGPRE